MKYKAIICDFDGTLVGPERIIAPQVKSAIKSATNAGYIFSLASGRLFNGFIENTCKELNLRAPQITKGGAEIVDPISRKVIDGEYIPDKFAQEIIAYLTSIHAIFYVEKEDTAYTIDGKPIEAVGPIPFKHIDALVIHNVPKISIGSFGVSTDEERKENELKKMYPHLNIINASSPSGKNWDITAALANKQSAVLKVAKYFALTPEEIIGIGDGNNDIPLLEACGYKVAMGNASESLKTIADYIAPSYHEYGVAIFLRNLLSQEKFR
ncbi:MAG: HAD family hydrolase [Candidatus Levyibacteriota bacterium]